jgi:hypothetical protein
VRTSYEVHCGTRRISLQRANTAREAIVEYLRSMGVRDDEMSTLGADAISWHGAVYRAVAVERDEPVSEQC